MKAHELARRLLEGPDYDAMIQPEDSSVESAADLDYDHEIQQVYVIGKE